MRWINRLFSRAVDGHREIVVQFSSRRKMSSEDFARSINMPINDLSINLVDLVRGRLSDVSGIEFEKIYPSDEFQGDLGDLLKWPELGLSIYYGSIIQKFELAVSQDVLETIPDLSSPMLGGNVGGFVMLAYTVISKVEKKKK